MLLKSTTISDSIYVNGTVVDTIVSDLSYRKSPGWKITYKELVVVVGDYIWN